MDNYLVLQVEKSQVTVPRGRYLPTLFTATIVAPAAAGQPAVLTYEHHERVRAQPSNTKVLGLLTLYTTPSIPDGEYSRGLDAVTLPPQEFTKSQTGAGVIQMLLGGVVFNQNPLLVPYVDYALEVYFSPPPPVAEGFKLEKTIAYLGYVAPPDAPFVPNYAIMPNLIGLTLTDADLALSDAGLILGIVTNRKHAATAGMVIGQSVAPYSLAPVDVPVNLIVSLGRTVGHHEVIIPDGMSGSTGPIKPS